MNFLLYKTGMNTLDKPRHGKLFLSSLSRVKFIKSNKLINVSPINKQDYLGYGKSKMKSSHDLIFTRTLRKTIQDYITPALIKMMLDISHNDFTSNGRFRFQGEMKSLTLPGTRQQKVILFTTLQLEKDKKVQILIGIDTAKNWNNHGRNKSCDFNKKALNSQYYYKNIYQQGILLLND